MKQRQALALAKKSFRGKWSSSKWRVGTGQGYKLLLQSIQANFSAEITVQTDGAEEPITNTWFVQTWLDADWHQNGFQHAGPFATLDAVLDALRQKIHQQAMTLASLVKETQTEAGAKGNHG